MHAAVHIADKKKGEQILLFTTSKGVERETFLAEIKARGISELYNPKAFVQVDTIPVLATGKIDYSEVAKMVVES